MCERLAARISVGGPMATTSPPAAPPSGPRSMIQSASLMMSRLCSMSPPCCRGPPTGAGRRSGARCRRSAAPWSARRARRASRCAGGMTSGRSIDCRARSIFSPASWRRESASGGESGEPAPPPSAPESTSLGESPGQSEGLRKPTPRLVATSPRRSAPAPFAPTSMTLASPSAGRFDGSAGDIGSSSNRFSRGHQAMPATCGISSSAG